MRIFIKRKGCRYIYTRGNIVSTFNKITVYTFNKLVFYWSVLRAAWSSLLALCEPGYCYSPHLTDNKIAMPLVINKTNSSSRKGFGSFNCQLSIFTMKKNSIFDGSTLFQTHCDCTNMLKSLIYANLFGVNSSK